jgi:phage/plasmid-like protein (TIGR03299 family)
MAHNLNENNGRVAFASKKEKAWHSLGTIVEAMTSKEAMELGGLNFTVAKRPILVEADKIITFDEAKLYDHLGRELHKETVQQDGVKMIKKSAIYRPLLTVPRKYATIRTDNGQPLGIVGEDYTIVQNSEAFDFIDSIIGEGKADYETVGALGVGETVFITCKLREECVINKDLIEQYLLITMSHDGTSSITVMFTPIRVVCNNTLTAALKGIKNKVNIRHTKTAKDRLEASKEVLGLVDESTRSYNVLFNHLNNITVADKQAEEIILLSLGLSKDEQNQLSTRAFNIYTEARDYYYSGLGQGGIVGTGWGVYNGITGYLQNTKVYRDDEVKFKNTFIGAGQETRNKAISLITTL